MNKKYKNISNADILRDPSLWVTIFAPTDEAFWAYASENNMTVAELLQQPWLVPVILNHIVGFKILVQAATASAMHNVMLVALICTTADRLPMKASAMPTEVFRGASALCCKPL